MLNKKVKITRKSDTGLSLTSTRSKLEVLQKHYRRTGNDCEFLINVNFKIFVGSLTLKRVS